MSENSLTLTCEWLIEYWQKFTRKKLWTKRRKPAIRPIQCEWSPEQSMSKFSGDECVRAECGVHPHWHTVPTEWQIHKCEFVGWDSRLRPPSLFASIERLVSATCSNDVWMHCVACKTVLQSYSFRIRIHHRRTKIIRFRLTRSRWIILWKRGLERIYSWLSHTKSKFSPVTNINAMNYKRKEVSSEKTKNTNRSVQMLIVCTFVHSFIFSICDDCCAKTCYVRRPNHR